MRECLRLVRAQNRAPRLISNCSNNNKVARRWHVCSRHIIKRRGHSSAVNTAPSRSATAHTYLDHKLLIIFLCGGGGNFAVIGALEYRRFGAKRGQIVSGWAARTTTSTALPVTHSACHCVPAAPLSCSALWPRVPFLTNIIHKDTRRETQSGAEIGMRFHYLKSFM